MYPVAHTQPLVQRLTQFVPCSIVQVFWQAWFLHTENTSLVGQTGGDAEIKICSYILAYYFYWKVFFHKIRKIYQQALTHRIHSTWLQIIFYFYLINNYFIILILKHSELSFPGSIARWLRWCLPPRCPGLRFWNDRLKLIYSKCFCGATGKAWIIVTLSRSSLIKIDQYIWFYCWNNSSYSWRNHSTHIQFVTTIWIWFQIDDL